MNEECPLTYSYIGEDKSSLVLQAQRSTMTRSRRSILWGTRWLLVPMGVLHTCGSASWWASFGGGQMWRWAGVETRRCSFQPLSEQPTVVVINLSSCWFGFICQEVSVVSSGCSWRPAFFSCGMSSCSPLCVYVVLVIVKIMLHYVAFAYGTAASPWPVTLTLVEKGTVKKTWRTLETKVSHFLEKR